MDDRILAELKRQKRACGPSVVAIQTFFSASDDGEFQKSSRSGAGVCVFVHGERALIVTSAHVVGLVSSVGAVHKCRLGRTFALTMHNKLLKTKVVAVNFAGDVAVLQAEAEAEADLPPPVEVSDSVPSTEVLLPPFMVITRHQSCDGGGVVRVRKCPREEELRRSEWPYDMEDGLGWVRYGLPDDEVNVVPGSPWFNFSWKVIGIASWPMGREQDGFVVHPVRIRSLIEYAKTKDPTDRVVIDPWISAPPTFADSEPLPQERFENVPDGFVATIRIPFNFPAWL